MARIFVFSGISFAFFLMICAWRMIEMMMSDRLVVSSVHVVLIADTMAE